MFHHRRRKSLPRSLNPNSLPHASTTRSSSSRLHQLLPSHLNSSPNKPPSAKKRPSSTSWSRNQKNRASKVDQSLPDQLESANQRFTSSSTRPNRKEETEAEAEAASLVSVTSALLQLPLSPHMALLQLPLLPLMAFLTKKIDPLVIRPQQSSTIIQHLKLLFCA